MGNETNLLSKSVMEISYSGHVTVHLVPSYPVIMTSHSVLPWCPGRFRPVSCQKHIVDWLYKGPLVMFSVQSRDCTNVPARWYVTIWSAEPISTWVVVMPHLPLWRPIQSLRRVVNGMVNTGWITKSTYFPNQWPWGVLIFPPTSPSRTLVSSHHYRVVQCTSLSQR